MKSLSFLPCPQHLATEPHLELDHWSPPTHTHTLRDKININVIFPPKKRHKLSAVFSTFILIAAKLWESLELSLTSNTERIVEKY